MFVAYGGALMDVILLVLDSLQLTDNYKVATPVDWKHADDVAIVPWLTDKDELDRRYPRGLQGNQAVSAHDAAAG